MSVTTLTLHEDDLRTTAPAAEAREIAYGTLASAGFTITPESEFTATCERGSAAMTLLFGAMAGKSRQHLRLRVTVFAAPDGPGSVVRVERVSSGTGAGIVGMARVRSLHREHRDQVAAALPR
ncbi:hypothetical protein [Luteimicrobium subarcticum]|uniref:DUF1499 domain-containing protein n=1 Tax=Luteimicrobium subarcticum TaxID=620910 RepID=A0A2M8W1V8_9MICO|nr:hypothetical protein [Luteimicrobium subarcticum]PJI84905.1 hypothetical protein CLV34_3152 [Luteimicrobium subarcticum]